MLRYIQKRLLIAIPVIWGVATIVFLLMHLLPGDPAQAMIAKSGGSPQAVEKLRQQLGLDRPLPEQYVRFLSQAVRGDLGESIWLRKPVAAVLRQDLPATLELAVAAACLAVIIGVPLGVLAAVHHNSLFDRLAVLVSVVGISMPVFWSGLLAMYLFAATLKWLPATGSGSLSQLIMPAAVLGWGAAGSIARLVRSSMLEELRQEYIVTARAKGLRERLVVLRHALRNSLIPAVTMLGMQFSGLLGGTVVVETVFSRRGLGRTLADAIYWKDFPLVQGGVMLIATIWVLVNLIVDLSYAFIDPRIRYS